MLGLGWAAGAQFGRGKQARTAGIVKSKTDAFSRMRSVLEDFGMVTQPCWSDHRMATCASVLPSWLAMAKSGVCSKRSARAMGQ